MIRVGARVWSPARGAGTVFRSTRHWVTVKWDTPSEHPDAPPSSVVTPAEVEPFLESHCSRCDSRILDGRCDYCAEVDSYQVQLTRSGHLPT